jgi:predicted RNA-binding protein YlxR (DUF448 family)
VNILKKIPSRTCIGCGTQKSKTELIRIVKTQSGEIKLDKTGKLPGRGAYICDKSECLNLAIRSKKLEKTFDKVPMKGCLQELIFPSEVICGSSDIKIYSKVKNALKSF